MFRVTSIKLLIFVFNDFITHFGLFGDILIISEKSGYAAWIIS